MSTSLWAAEASSLPGASSYEALLPVNNQTAGTERYWRQALCLAVFTIVTNSACE